MVAVSDAGIRERLVAALRAAGIADAETVVDPLDAIGVEDGEGVLLISQTGFARESDPVLNLLLSLRFRWTVIVVYEDSNLLEAASVFGVVDGWLPLDLVDDRVRDTVLLGREGYAVLPRVPDPETGLDSIRRIRLAALEPVARRIVCRVARGETNAQIARAMRLSEERVAGSIRRSLRRLCLERRLQVGVFLARLVAARRSRRKSGSDGNSEGPGAKLLPGK